jgi:hypothetical protein
MQTDKEHYNAERHDKFKAISVRQPFANDLAEGYKTIEIRHDYTTYRGDVVLCSACTPSIPKLYCGFTLAMLELYDCKPLSEMTEKEWWSTRVAKKKRDKLKGRKDIFAWCFRNPRKLIEYPVKWQYKGLWNLYYTKGDIQEYPSVVLLDV